jgi:hypothetical protein
MSSLRVSGPWFALLVCLVARQASAQFVILLPAEDFVREPPKLTDKQLSAAKFPVNFDGRP